MKNSKNHKKSKHSLHDHLVKEVYSQPKYSLDILKLVFSEEELNLFDWTTLKTEATTFVDKEWREKHMDLLLSAVLKKSSNKQRGRILFLMEHKSQYDPELMRQFLMYQTGIYQRTRDPVIPVFINQSPEKGWRGPKDFQGFLRNFDGLLREYFHKNVLNFSPRGLDIQSEEVQRRAKGLTTHPILFILKSIWNLDESKVRELFTISRALSPVDREALVLRAVDYVRRCDPYFSWKITSAIESQIMRKEDRLMTPILQSSLEEAKQEGWQKGQQEGWQKGQQEGMQARDREIVSNMLKSQLDTSLICKVTGLSEEEINKLKNRSRS